MEPSDIDALILGPAVRALAPVPDAPRLSAASAAPLREIAAVDEQGAARTVHLPIERPLTIVVDGREIVTLMTLGAAPEWLVLGYLRNQRLIDEVTRRSIRRGRLEPGRRERHLAAGEYRAARGRRGAGERGGRPASPAASARSSAMSCGDSIRARP